MRCSRPGLSSKEIAFQLKLSPKTIDVHRARIMERLDLRDVASLTRYAVRRGLVKRREPSGLDSHAGRDGFRLSRQDPVASGRPSATRIRDPAAAGR